MYSRPKPGETEEDILKLQEEFKKQKSEKKITLAATVVSNKLEAKPKENESAVVETSQMDVEEQLANTFEAIPSDMKLNQIVEKKTETQTIVPTIFAKGTGFPKAKRRDLTLQPGHGSIFAQEIKRFKKSEIPMEVDTPVTSHSIVIKENHLPSTSADEKPINTKTLPLKSFILMGSDSNQIHEENIKVMKQMTEVETIVERERLIETMDPAIIAFLKSRSKKEVIENRNPTIQEQNQAAEDIKLEEIETTAHLLAQPKADKWLNFDIIESNKLAWMKNVNVTKIKKSEEYEARFDFEGWLLPYSESEINEKNRILYHHGEEPGRPGYTLQELFQLSRSSIIQQKITALNAIANILALHSTGVYDEILDLPIEQIFFVIRFCLDDNTPAVLNASIKAMRNLIFSQVDEVCLDSLLGFGLGMVQPLLAVDNEMEDDNTVNDQQLAEKNLVKCLARTEILTRIRYIINTVKPPLETIVYCLDILVRLGRDSDFLISKIFNSEGLLDAIIKNFLPTVLSVNSTSPYGLPLLQAVKFIRILSSRNKDTASKLLHKYKLLDSIVMYLSNENFSANVNGMRLQTECMHYWSLLVQYGLGLDYFNVLTSILVSLLDYHYKNTDFLKETTYARIGHASSLLILLGQVANQNFTLVKPFLPLLIHEVLKKWVMQFSTLKEIQCGKLQLIASLIYCMSRIISCEHHDLIDEIVIYMISGGKSVGFDKVVNSIQNGSMLLNNYQTHKTSANLKSLEAAAWHTMDHVVPVIQTNSGLLLLYAISEYVSISNNLQVKSLFLKAPGIQEYLMSLQKLEKYYLINNWFARPECFILMNILKTSVALRPSIDPSLFYEIAVKCLSIFNCEQKPDIEYLFNKIIFCPEFYPSEILLEHLDIGDRNTNLEISLNNLGEILEVYTQILDLKNNIPDLSRCCCIDISIGNVIPMDWIYTPILLLYVNQLQNKSNTEEALQIFTVRNCLRWILIYETYFPFLASGINPTDKFCRLACVFLGSDNLFLTTEIHDLLQLCFKNIISKFENELNFKKEIQGLSNFQDFYTQLLEQYQSVSYGDTLFGNIILVPLAQRHDMKYRKMLWSEYMGVVQVFNVTPSEIFSNLESFLQPSEEDMSLLTCYRRAIVSKAVRKHSVLYTIANHHIENFIKKKKAIK